MTATETEIPLSIDARIPSARGLICAYTTRGQSLGLTTLKKWARLYAQVYKAEKVDVRLAQNNLQVFEELLRFETDPPLRYSARLAPGSISHEHLETWQSRGVWDIMLEVNQPEWDALSTWIDTARKLEIPVRVEIEACALHTRQDVELSLNSLKLAQSVNLALYGPLAQSKGNKLPRLKPDQVKNLVELAKNLVKANVEVNILGLAFCQLPEELWPHCINAQQYRKDHQQYIPTALETCVVLAGLAPHAVDKVLEIELGRQTSWHSQIDNLVLPWILHHPSAYVRVWMLHKMFRHLYLKRKRPKPLPETVSEVDAAIEQLCAKQRRSLGPICAECKFQHICDHQTELRCRVAPELGIQALPGEPLNDPLAFLKNQPKWWDKLDEKRHLISEITRNLAQKALKISTQGQPTREISSESYDGEGHHCHHMPGTVRWHSFDNVEVLSTVLARLEPPFTIGLTFGGGIAAQIGFSFGRHAKIICPMIAHTHKLVLHVDKDGCYALLRDGVLVRPTEFLGHRLLPPRLGGVLEPRISLWNIDGQISTQNILLWEETETVKREAAVKYTVLVVSTRYSRRLQAALLGLAHQQGIDPAQLEVIVAYVPGIDSTDDLLDSLALSHPELCVIRSPFPKYHIRSKGFMINESVKSASGEWVVLLDSDIVLPPDFFRRLAQEAGDARFCAPDGRKMLSPETTACVLLGEVRPWEAYPALLDGPGDVRVHESDGIPPGFCQCVRREVFEAIRYTEFEHFEGADWEFAKSVVQKCGGVKRLEGMLVLHLDHQGSQWYGTDKQM